MPLNQRRAYAVAGVVGGRLLVAGGADDSYAALTSVEAYTTTGWIHPFECPPLPEDNRNSTACVLNGRLHVMGGLLEDKLQVLEMSAENEFSWTIKADLPDPRQRAGSVVLDGKVWLIGGTSADNEYNDVSTDSVAIYDARLDSWAAGPALPCAVWDCRATVYAGEIYAFVVVCCEGGRKALFIYRNGAWEEDPEKLEAMADICESVLLG